MTNALTVTAPEGLPFIDTEREFDAPLAAVWRAYTEPELIAQWMGPHGSTLKDLEFEARTGGSWGYTHVGEDGSSFGFRGVLHSVEEHKSMTQTFEFSGCPGHVSLERADFEDLDGRTRIRTRSAFQSVEDRDGMVGSGMEGGMSESYERLDELLKTL
ncbi:MAG: SRPBCC family protein [Actinomycetota bacterium]|nr:SRPBCC family protein [Actinomycetota bacterium]